MTEGALDRTIARQRAAREIISGFIVGDRIAIAEGSGCGQARS
jgi:hypothetical protein